jgi:hypothetical protein
MSIFSILLEKHWNYYSTYFVTKFDYAKKNLFRVFRGLHNVDCSEHGWGNEDGIVTEECAYSVGYGISGWIYYYEYKKEQQNSVIFYPAVMICA